MKSPFLFVFKSEYPCLRFIYWVPFLSQNVIRIAPSLHFHRLLLFLLPFFHSMWLCKEHARAMWGLKGWLILVVRRLRRITIYILTLEIRFGFTICLFVYSFTYPYIFHTSAVSPAHRFQGLYLIRNSFVLGARRKCGIKYSAEILMSR